MADLSLAPIGAAIVTSAAALLGLIISKEGKVSEFRQAWVDALRKEAAEMVAQLNAVRTTLRLGKGGEAAWEKEAPRVIQANTHLAQMRLRLNPTEPPNQKVLELLSRIESLYAGDADWSDKAFEDVEKDFLEAMQVVLKIEWDKTRDGEITFRAVKWMFGMVFAGLSGFAVGRYF